MFFILKSCYEEINIIPILSCMFPIFPSHHPQTSQTLQTSPRSWPEVGSPLGPSSCVSEEQGLQESTHSLSCAPKLGIQEL